MSSEMFNRVVKYVVENVGKTFSANAIVKFLKSEGRSLSVESVYNYLEWLEKVFVVYRCQRYDLQGKFVLKTQEKFYLADASLKYCRMGFNPSFIASMLENIVCFELLRKGYEGEIDNLLAVEDHYPKYVVTLDELAAGNINGVKIVHLADFLLAEDY